jgi:peptidyl-prolyl cis-trans isomerase SurA
MPISPVRHLGRLALRPLLAGLALSVALLAGDGSQAAARGPEVRDLDRILAVVNEDVITASELAVRLTETKKQLRLEGIGIPPDEVLEKQVLERMVLERLQLQVAERTGIRAADAEVERALESIARRNNLAPDDFLRRLEREGLDAAAFREQIRTQLVIRQLLEREIGQRIHVSEAEIAAFLENQERDLNVSYHLSHIFLPVPESPSPEAIQAVKRQAEEIHRELRSGGSFEQLAIAHSRSPEALQGGSLGWRTAGQLPELFLAALKETPVGGVSEVIRGPNGFHILKLNERRGQEAVKPVTQTHVRHILLRPSEILSVEEARARLLQLRERILHGDDFAALARAHSEDLASAANGGDLSWVNPGQLVPEFERAMNALGPGEISEPARTPFGWHLIQVLERRVQDIAQERLRAQAREQIHARKADERYEQWLRQLRDEAYVEYLVEDVN